MKKLLISLVMLLFVKNVIYAVSGDLFAVGKDEEFRINSAGDPLTSNGLGFDVTWIDIPASSSATFTVSSAGGGAVISTATLVASGTTFVEGAAYVIGANKFLQITSPRNIVCELEFLNGIATTTANGTLTVTGKDGLGVSTTETISVSTKTAAAPGIGVKAWSWIDSFAFSAFTISSATGGGGALTPISTCTIHIGVGSKIGLSYDVTLTTDVSHITVNYVAYSSATWKSVNSDYDTIDTSQFSTGLTPDGSRDYRVRGKALKKH